VVEGEGGNGELMKTYLLMRGEVWLEGKSAGCLLTWSGLSQLRLTEVWERDRM